MTNYQELLDIFFSKSCVYPLYLLLFFKVCLFHFKIFFSVATTAAYTLRECDAASFIFYCGILGVILTNWQMQKVTLKCLFGEIFFYYYYLIRGGGTELERLPLPSMLPAVSAKAAGIFLFYFHFILYLENMAFIFTAISLASCLFMPALFTDLIYFYEILSFSCDWRFSCCLLKDVFLELV